MNATAEYEIRRSCELSPLGREIVKLELFHAGESLPCVRVEIDAPDRVPGLFGDGLVGDTFKRAGVYVALAESSSLNASGALMAAKLFQQAASEAKRMERITRKKEIGSRQGRLDVAAVLGKPEPRFRPLWAGEED